MLDIVRRFRYHFPAFGQRVRSVGIEQEKTREYLTASVPTL